MTTESPSETTGKSRLPPFAGAPVLALGIWLAVCQISAIIAGGVALVPVLTSSGAIFLVIAGLTILRSNSSRNLKMLGSSAAVLFLMSWLAFSFSRDWKSAYRYSSVLSRVMDYDPYSLESKAAFIDGATGGNVPLSDIMRKLSDAKEKDVGYVELSVFKLKRYVRLSFWPPFEFLSNEGCRKAFDGARGGQSNSSAMIP
jgi:hypothetical protein